MLLSLTCSLSAYPYQINSPSSVFFFFSFPTLISGPFYRTQPQTQEFNFVLGYIISFSFLFFNSPLLGLHRSIIEPRAISFKPFGVKGYCSVRPTRWLAGWTDAQFFCVGMVNAETNLPSCMGQNPTSFAKSYIIWPRKMGRHGVGGWVWDHMTRTVVA